MNFLTHVFLPLTVAYVLRRESFNHPSIFGLSGFGLLSDLDKFLGMPGLLHSLVTLVPICVAILGVEWWYKDEWQYAPLIVGFIGSHVLLDFIGGGPIPLLYPFIDSGIGLQYPARIAFGEGPIGVSLVGPVVTVRGMAPRPGYNTYGFINGEGVAWVLVFVVLYLGLRRRDEFAQIVESSSD